MKMTKSKLVLSTFILLLVSIVQFGWSMGPPLNKETSPTLSSLAPEAVSTKEDIQTLLPNEWPSSGLLIFPDVGRKAWLDAINSAKKSIQMAAYKLSDEAIMNAIIKAINNNHIKVDILIQPEIHKHGQSLNVETPIDLLKKEGIHVHTLSNRFNQAHYKMIIVDEKWGMVSSGNLDSESFDSVPTISAAACRDFAITITNPKIVEELSKVYKADIIDKRISPPFSSQLVWGPDNQRSVFLRMINSARKSIRIYQQDFTDIGIVQAVAGAARAGVMVEVIMMPFPFGKTEDKNIPNQKLIQVAGGKVYLHTYHYMHAKVMIIDGDYADNRLMYIGSCNFYTPSLDQTRELGVLTTDGEQIRQVNAVFESDLLKITPTP
jgi:cardiolipin synthase